MTAPSSNRARHPVEDQLPKSHPDSIQKGPDAYPQQNPNPSIASAVEMSFPEALAAQSDSPGHALSNTNLTNRKEHKEAGHIGKRHNSGEHDGEHGGEHGKGRNPHSHRDTRTDESLLEAYRFGDEAAFTMLVERYQRELFHFLIRFLGDRAAAEDCFQESFLQVYQSAEQFDLQRRFRPWLFTIAANKARDLIRSLARRPTNPLQASVSPGDEESGQFIDLMQSASQMPSEPLEAIELQGQVQNTVMEMPDHLREILILSYFYQFPYKQIGEILNIPLGTVKSRLHAAVAHFADRWHALQQNKPTSH